MLPSKSRKGKPCLVFPFNTSQLPDLQNQLLLDRMCLVEFILLLLSSSRDFSVRLNDQVEVTSDLGFPGSPCCLADHVLFAIWK